MSMIEFEIGEAVSRVLVEAVAELGGRVIADQTFPADRRYWPCAIVDTPRFDYVHKGTMTGSRPRTGSGILTITVGDDGTKPDIKKSHYQIAQKIDDALTGATIRAENGDILTDDISCKWSHSATQRYHSATLRLRQVGFSLTYRTREGDTQNTLSA